MEDSATHGNTGVSAPRSFCGVLVITHSAFSATPVHHKQLKYVQKEFSVTNIGVKTTVQTLVIKSSNRNGFQYVLPLDCTNISGKHLGILLRRCGPEKLVRENPALLLEDMDMLAPHTAVERYLLTDLPECDCCRSSTVFSIGHIRSHILSFRTPSQLAIYKVWPLSRYDDKVEWFFFQNEMAWDVAAFDLNGSIDVNLVSYIHLAKYHEGATVHMSWQAPLHSTRVRS
jgi:hypothetical protein